MLINRLSKQFDALIWTGTRASIGLNIPHRARLVLRWLAELSMSIPNGLMKIEQT